MQGTCNPDWGPINWPDDVIQCLRSPGLLTIHVYVYNRDRAPARRPAPGHIVPHQSAIAQRTASHLADPAMPSPSQMSSADQSFIGGESSSDGTEHQASELHNTDMQATSDHPPLAASRTLILSAEVNLDELHVFQDDLPALDVCLPPNTLVLELTDGMCLFPSLDVHNASSDLSPLADKATASVSTIPGPERLQHQRLTGHAVPDAGSITEQVCSFSVTCQHFLQLAI